jgi:hypothetical protein
MAVEADVSDFGSSVVVRPTCILAVERARQFAEVANVRRREVAGDNAALFLQRLENDEIAGVLDPIGGPLQAATLTRGVLQI